MALLDDVLTSSLLFDPVDPSTLDAPPAGKYRLAVNESFELVLVDDALVETPLGSGGGGSSSSNPSTIKAQGAAVLVTNTTTETTIFTATVPGGTLGTNGSLVFEGTGRVNHAVAGTATVRVKFGATTLLTLVVSNGAVVADKLMAMRFVLSANGATNAQYANGWVEYLDAAVSGAKYPTRQVSTSEMWDDGTATEDSTADKTFAITVQWDSASTDLDWTQQAATLTAYQATAPGADSGDITLIERLSPSGVATITSASIVGTYKSLKILARLKGTDAAAQLVNMQFNGDTGTNYAYSRLFLRGNDTVGSGAESDNQTGIPALIVPPVGLTNIPLTAEITIPGYADTVDWKMVEAHGTHHDGTVFFAKHELSGLWKDTDAITTITFAPAAGNFAAGSTIDLYGLA